MKDVSHETNLNEVVTLYLKLENSLGVELINMDIGFITKEEKTKLKEAIQCILAIVEIDGQDFNL